MLKSLLALLSGVIFGLGLIIAGMANPAKVLAFLDITGQWDPSLAVGGTAADPGRRACGSPFAGGQRAVRHRLGHGGHLPWPGLGVGGGGNTTGMAVPAGDAGGHGAV